MRRTRFWKNRANHRACECATVPVAVPASVRTCITRSRSPRQQQGQRTDGVPTAHARSSNADLLSWVKPQIRQCSPTAESTGAGRTTDDDRRIQPSSVSLQQPGSTKFSGPNPTCPAEPPSILFRFRSHTPSTTAPPSEANYNAIHVNLIKFSAQIKHP